MLNEPRWLAAADIVVFNKQLVDQTDEPHFLRDEGLLESACQRPIHRWLYSGEVDVIRLATALAYGIARNHPFEQGNKRTAFVAAAAFMEDNGWSLGGENDEALGLVIERLAAGRAGELDLDQAFCVCAKQKDAG